MLSGGAGLNQATSLYLLALYPGPLRKAWVRGYQPTQKKFNEIMEKIKAKVEITH